MSCPAGISDGRGEDDFFPGMGYVRLTLGRGGMREGGANVTRRAKTTFQSRAIPPEDREAEAVQLPTTTPAISPSHNIDFVPVLQYLPLCLN